MSGKLVPVILGSGLLAACGGGSSASSSGGSSSTPSTYTIGGSVSGLSSGASLSLANNGGDSMNVAANGSFTFKASLDSGAAYSVSILEQPGGENCSVSNASGTVASAGVSNVAINCSSTPNPAAAGISQSNAPQVAAEVLLTMQTLGGSGSQSPTSTSATASPSAAHFFKAVSSNAASSTTVNCALSGTLVLATAAGDTSASATFNQCQETSLLAFNGELSYSNLSLSATAGGGSQISASIDNTLTVTLGSLSAAASGDYSFVLQYAPLQSAAFTLSDMSLSASIKENGMPVDSSSVTNANISLTDDLALSPNQLSSNFAYTVASTALNGSITLTTVQTVKQIADPHEFHTFPYTGQLLIVGSNKTRAQVTILGDETFLPPAGEGQLELQIDSGSGSFGAPIYLNWASIAAIYLEHVAGATPTYSIGGSVSGLAAGASVSLSDDEVDPVTVAADGTFTFLTPLPAASGYSVTVARQPHGATCTVSDGSGTVASAAVSNISVTCQ
jgi:hypothetical protein